MAALPRPWLSYTTQDGKEYYYNPQTKVTTWDRPKASESPPKETRAPAQTASASTLPTSTSEYIPSGGAGRGGLLADIRKGAQLKKVTTRESSPLENVASSGSDTKQSGSASESSAGGGINDMMAAIRARGNLRKTSSRNESAGSQPVPTSSTPSGGGFAEIMRKNREAAARKSTPSMSSDQGSSVTRRPSTGSSMSSYSNVNHSTLKKSEIEDRLCAIETKLDKIMSHLGIT